MKLRTKKQGIALCCSLVALGVVSGVAAVSTAPAAADSVSVNLLTGARIKALGEAPSLKFEAVVTGYDETDTAITYGMLLIPQTVFAAQTFDNDYHAVLSAASVTDYIDAACTPYAVGETTQIAALVPEIAEADYAKSYVAVAYAKNGDTYAYDGGDLVENARSIAYVAQMSLTYDGITDEGTIEKLTAYAVDETYDTIASYDEKNSYSESGLTATGGVTASDKTDYQAKIVGSAIGGNSWIALASKNYYQGITEVTFNAKAKDIPGRWCLSFRENEANYQFYVSTIDNGMSGGGNTTAVLKKDNVWYTYKFTMDYDLQEVVCSYKVMGSEGDFTQLWYVETPLDFENVAYEAYFYVEPKATNPGFIWIDDLTITYAEGTVTEGFDVENFADCENFKAPHNAEAVVTELISEKGVKLGATTGNTYAELELSALEDNGGKTSSFITKQAYKNLQTINFDLYIPATAAPTGWWGFALTSGTNVSKYTANNMGVLNKITVRDQWINVTYSSADNGATWSVVYETEDGTKTTVAENIAPSGAFAATDGSSYVQVITNFAAAKPCIDNVTIVADGETYTDGFDGGESALFNVQETGRLNGTPATMVAETALTYAELVEAGTVGDTVLASDTAITAKEILNAEGLNESALLLTAEVSYKITGEKAFAIAFGESDYIIVTEGKIALYSENTLVKEINGAVEATLRIALTAGGNLLVSVNGADYVGLGTVQDALLFAIVDVAGTGSVVFEAIKANAYQLVELA